jgi:hypothetical protein
MIDAYCNDEATLIISGGYVGGIPEPPTTDTIKTKYFDKQKLVRNTNGEQVVASGYFLIPKDITLTNEDRIKIDTVEYIIMTIEKMKDFSQSHYKVWVQ